MTHAWMPAALIVIASAIGLHIFSRFTRDLIDPYLAGLIGHAVALAVVAVFFFMFSSMEAAQSAAPKGWIYAVITGAFIGIANLFVFVMYKQGAPVSVAVPFVRVSVVVGTVALGLVLFSETLTATKMMGLILSVISICLLVA